MILIDTQKEEFAKLKDINIFGKADEDKKYNGDFLVIGLGGVGMRVVTSLKGMLMNDITPEDNINFLGIDSCIPEMQQTIEESKEGIGLNALEVISIYRPNVSDLLINGIENNPVSPTLANWMRKDFPNIAMDTEGAKGNRQIGRLMFSNAYEDMRYMLFDKLDEIYGRSKNKLDIIIVSSVSGGTGSGIISDLTYNIKAYAKSKRWDNVRVGGCLLMPDVLFGIKKVREDLEKKQFMLANGYATLKEINHYMHVTEHGHPYTFESTTHRLNLKSNIFKACMLVTGKKDSQGYIPDTVIYSDVAYYLLKLAKNKYIGAADEMGQRKLTRDSFFDNSDVNGFKIVSASDYKIPIKEIENLCENRVFNEAFPRLFQMPAMNESIRADIDEAFRDLEIFLNGQPGDEINFQVSGLINASQYQRPVYKQIKKGTDELREAIPKQLKKINDNISVTIKEIKMNLCNVLDKHINKYLQEYGPFITLQMIGASGVYGLDQDQGMIAKVKELEKKQRYYQPTNEYTRIKESILDIVSKRFFTFPSAKRETEAGYFDACIKEAHEKERTFIMFGLDSQDLFGDVIRLLRNRAEHLDDLYSPFRDDLEHAVHDLAANGERVIGYLLKDSNRHEFLPSDFVTENRIEEMRRGIIRLMVNHEAEIDNGRPVPIKQEMEKTYKAVLIGVGGYAPEKLIAVAFAKDKPNLAETNMMFVSPDSEVRKDIMSRAAKAFLKGAVEKTEKKRLCAVKAEFTANRRHTDTYVSLPVSMPFFSQGIKELFMDKPYNIAEDSITLNAGDAEISVDEILYGVSANCLECIDEMRAAYDMINPEVYYGLHIDETIDDMRSYMV